MGSPNQAKHDSGRVVGGTSDKQLQVIHPFLEESNNCSLLKPIWLMDYLLDFTKGSINHLHRSQACNIAFKGG